MFKERVEGLAMNIADHDREKGGNSNDRAGEFAQGITSIKHDETYDAVDRLAFVRRRQRGNLLIGLILTLFCVSVFAYIVYIAATR